MTRTRFDRKVAVSQSLWRQTDEVGVLGLLPSLQVEGLCVQAERICPGYADRSGGTAAFERFGNLLSGLNLQPVALQSIIPAGHTGRIFAGKERQKELTEAFRYAAQACGALGAPVMTFASPGLRNGAFMARPQDVDIASEFFDGVAAICAEHGVRLMMEPCPQDYGCDFGRDMTEVSALLSRLSNASHTGIHLNTSCLLLEEGMMRASLAAHGCSAHHMDVCDPFSKLASDRFEAGHRGISEVLERLRGIGHGPRWLCAAGRPADLSSSSPAIARVMTAVSYLRRLYLPGGV